MASPISKVTIERAQGGYIVRATGILPVHFEQLEHATLGARELLTELQLGFEEPEEKSGKKPAGSAPAPAPTASISALR